MNQRRVARPSVLRSLSLDRHTVVEASAGTGKTFTLEHLIVELLIATDVPFDRILTVSFTEKATNEIRVRVRAKLEELVAGGVGPTTEQVASGDYWTIDDTVQRRLEKALRSFDGATIATIHAFCQRVLRENAFASGRLFEEHQIDGREVFARALRDALRRDVACDRDRAPWLEAALRTGWSMARIEDLLWDCIQSHGELRPVFDASALDAALAAFPVGIAGRSDGPAEMQRWGMPSQTAKAVVKRLDEIARVVDVTAARGAPAYVMAAEHIDFSYLLGKLPPFAPRPGPMATLCAAALRLARATPPLCASLAQALLPAVRAELVRRKRDAGQYDFDDMLSLVDDALHGPGARRLGAAMRKRWRRVLIDEFQDTDETQWSIFRRAFFESGPTEGMDPASVLYLVGDPKQSIYRFRGADVHTYLRAKGEIVSAGGQCVALDRNYRGTPSIVAVTNALFDPSVESPVFTGDIEYAPVGCGRPDRTLVDGDGRAVSPLCVMAVRSGADVRTLSGLGAFIAREIRALTDAARPFRFDGRPLDPSDVFVLTRNAREGRAVGVALRAAGVPHTFYKQDGLFQTDEARELRTLLVAIERPADRASRLSAWLTPFFGLPLASLERAGDLGGSHPLVARLHAWKALADAREFDRLFESIVVESGVVRREIFFGDDERELTNYTHLFELLLEHAHRTHPTLREVVQALSGFIDRTRLPLDLEGNVQRLESERRAVQVMTIHKSKGLEAPIVFVAGGFSQSPADDVHVYHDRRRLAWVGRVRDPAVDAQVKREEREEDQRLMYVALTRAQGRLYLPCAMSQAHSNATQGEPRSMRGPYQMINRRVAELVSRPDVLLWSLEDASVEDTSVEHPAADRRDSHQAVEAPCPPAAPPALASCDKDQEAAKFAELRRSHAGPFVTSYTRLKGEGWSGEAWKTAPTAAGAQGAEPRAEAVDESAPSLRGARASGVFLHEVLERVPLESFATSSQLGVWRSSADVARLFEQSVAAHGIERAERAHAEELVWTAFTTPLALPGGDRIDRIAAAHRVARELGFVFSVTDPAAGAPGAARPTTGFVRGSIDIAFEHRGLTHFVDWKSDSLPTYAPSHVADHVRAHYAAQAQLYALAMTRLLGCRGREEYDTRFGGMVYCYLRGLNAQGEGVWSARPTWDEIAAWDGRLGAIRDGRPRR